MKGSKEGRKEGRQAEGRGNDGGKKCTLQIFQDMIPYTEVLLLKHRVVKSPGILKEAFVKISTSYKPVISSFLDLIKHLEYLGKAPNTKS